ncbi:hypothetical protein [Aquibacillus rhizosphaerae]|uniref:Uncharacterized protein n=1 Tax=Aquibacillus rhizosphaerae TaxID=3051431 RepID=A0ABT7LB66_9BACI|nr:hypothetical protein [Aquibacillus sp. LR5S19]MDL4842659.1 hypothetical protein [Aquibacillus sp. LR5S19]
MRLMFIGANNFTEGPRPAIVRVIKIANDMFLWEKEIYDGFMIGKGKSDWDFT